MSDEKTADITVSVSELIPTAQYANVTVGPFTVTRTVPDDDNIEQAIKDTYDVADRALQQKRDEVIASVKGK